MLAPTFVAGDINGELINWYTCLAASVDDMLIGLADLADDKETYYGMRSWRPQEAMDRAVRFYYLNRTSYLGLYRVNQDGQLNVPYDGGHRFYLDRLELNLRAAAKAVSFGRFYCDDFQVLIDGVQATDLVILDPPYGVQSDKPYRRYHSQPPGLDLLAKLNASLFDLCQMEISTVLCIGEETLQLLRVPGSFRQIARRDPQRGSGCEVMLTNFDRPANLDYGREWTVVR